MRINNEDFKFAEQIAGRDITTDEVIDILNEELNKLGWKVYGGGAIAPDGQEYYITADEGLVRQEISVIKQDRWLKERGWL